MVENGHGNGHMNGGSAEAAGNGGAVGTFRVKAGLAQMLKGGVIMGMCVRPFCPWLGLVGSVGRLTRAQGMGTA